MDTKKYLLTWVKWFIVIVIIVFSLLFLHELMHSFVCFLIGGNPSFNSILPHMSVYCEGVVVEGKLMVSNFQYILYAMIPYIVWITFLFIIYFKKIDVRLTYIVSSYILLDTLYNYILSIFKPTDFRLLFVINSYFFVVFSFLVIIIVIISFNILVNRWKELKKYGKKVWK